MLLLILFGFAVIVICAYLVKRPTVKTPTPEQTLAAMEAKLSQLQEQLDSLPDEDLEDEGQSDDTEREASARDWAAREHSPAFDTGTASIPLHIAYRDDDGSMTERSVIVERYSYGRDGGTISAHCNLRNGRRTFLFHRITRAIDPSTGEEINALGPWLDAAYAASPQGKAQGIIDIHSDALLALLYVAKADGAFRAKEKQAVQTFLELQAVAPADAEVIVGLMPRWAHPSAIGYGKVLAALSAGKAATYHRQVLEAAFEIVASDQTRYPQEDRAIKRMQEALGQS